MGEAKRRKQLDPAFGTVNNKEPKHHTFLCKEDDGDSYLLVDLTMAQKARSGGVIPIKDVDEQFAATLLGGLTPGIAMGCCVWVTSEIPLQEGKIYNGSFSFDPKLTLKKGRMPEFILEESN